jgi:hypothetical protein
MGETYHTKASSTIDSADDLNKLFADEVARFAAVFPACADTRWCFTPLPYTLPGKIAYRDVAYAEVDRVPRVVVFHPKILGRRTVNVVAVIRHELGHICDPWVMSEPLNREQRADNIAEHVTGQRIYYDHNDMQTLEVGQYPRPAHLHQ